MKSKFRKIIEEICAEEKINLSAYSFDWILQLEKNNKIRHIVASHFDLNPQAAAEIMNDKYATYCVLKSYHIPIIEHKILFNPLASYHQEGKKSVINSALLYFRKHNNEIVVKANDGLQGKEIFLCKSEYSLEKNILGLFKTRDAISLCPYYQIKYEYRVFVLKDKILFIYGKDKPHLLGDGINTIRDLLIKENALITKTINYNLDDIPNKGEKIFLSWKHNLSQGAKAFSIEDNMKKSAIEELALKAAKAINVGFATVDISELDTGELMVMEINSSVSTGKMVDQLENGYEIAKNIYHQAILEMFKQ